MKKLFYLISIGIGLLSLSCSDFTDVGLPRDQITREMVFRDEALANSAMAGIYRSLEGAGFLSGSSSGANIYLASYTDELTSYATATTPNSQFHLLSHSADSQGVSNIWSKTYSQIYSINSMIEGLHNSGQLESSVKNKLLGESHFLRALLHLYLTMTFGDIPFVETSNYETNTHATKLSRQVVLQKASADLLLASQLLPSTLPKGSRIRPTKMAAFAVLARLSCYTENWDDAILYASAVLSDPAYSMEATLDSVFLKDSSSAIWQILPYNSTSSTMEGNLFILKATPPKNIALTPLFISGFESGDLRKTKWIGEIKDAQNNTYFYPFKYKQSSTAASSTEYSVILRVEELYLIRAEAWVRKANSVAALVDLNRIRSRAGLPEINAQNSAELLPAILKERRYELFTEFGHRFYDLSHFGVLNQYMTSVKPNWKNHFILWPIPAGELLLNPNLNPQNNGY